MNLGTKCIAIASLAALAFGSCKKDDNSSSGITPYTVPTTYNFTGIDSVPAKTMLAMLGELEIAINKGNTSGVVVSNTVLKGMFSNTGGYFTDTTIGSTVYKLNSSSINLKSKTTPTAQPVIEALMDSIYASSQSTKVADVSGVAGVSTSKTLLSGNGFYWRQTFTKSMMGVLLQHQITDVYLTDSLNSNISIAAKQHAWDQAFLLWHVPVDFPTTRTNVKYWGSYSSQIDSGLNKTVVNNTGINSNPTLVKAFLTGRAALGGNDLATAQAQAAIIIAMFEKMEAAAELHECNEAEANIANGVYPTVGNISESFGFFVALNYNTQKKIISSAQVTTLGSLYGSNFYKLTQTNLESIKSAISTVYGWDTIKAYL